MLILINLPTHVNSCILCETGYKVENIKKSSPKLTEYFSVKYISITNLQLHRLIARNIHPTITIWPKSKPEPQFFSLHILDSQRKALQLRQEEKGPAQRQPGLVLAIY